VINLLKNPDFEAGFRNVNGIGELTVANDWLPWWALGRSAEGNQDRHRPEYKPELRSYNSGRGRVLDGNQGQKVFTTFAPHCGGIYQTISVTPGIWYRLSGWAYLWGSSKDNPDEAAKPWPKMSAMAGINPWGRVDFAHRTTVWGMEALDQYNAWCDVSVIAQAWSHTITVTLASIAEYGTKHVDAYWDKASLVELGDWGTTEPPTPPEPPPAGTVDYDRIGRVVRAELDSTHWISGP